MRLTEEERTAIVAAVKKFDDTAEVYLFGSRMDDAKRGGDIDILVKSDILNQEMRGLVEDELFRHIEEQKVDFVFTGKTDVSAFAAMVLSRGALQICQMKS